MTGAIFISFGILLVMISSIGIIRFSDFYVKLHVAGIIDSSGAALLLTGIALQSELSMNTIKIVLLTLIIWINNSTNSYILAQTYYKMRNKRSVNV
ncbi:MAG: monovalent cation/H(+) antiporter subunit G [Wolbachia endosymbiont of Fragariocoptes setiger]|nr:monovalent cation/H(+) antiporter subunit G [Wolbachia endosymbiont of Fragariocoptes setiger]